MKTLQSTYPPKLDHCNNQVILDYFENAWQLEDILFKSLVGSDTFYVNPDPLRNPLIFYLGHSVVFYINKLIQVGLLKKRLNRDYEILFEFGVDPETPEELNSAIAHLEWPEVADVWEYRQQAYSVVLEMIETTPITLPIDPNHPLWALMMGIEHQRIHIETSSMLFRQLPTTRLKRPKNWEYAPFNGYTPQNELVEVAGGVAKLGKSYDDPTYGWDIDYGLRTVEVSPFLASKYLITNAEFVYFVKAGGYENQEYWDEESWRWKTQYNIQHPRFWLHENGSYKYRAMFDEMDLPLDWPVEVNHYEAMAYCRWRGKDTRLMSEAEYNVATYGNGLVELEITKGAREMGMPLLWPNGLELRKATLGRGRNYDHTDLTPDEEMIEALWGWDGKVGGFLGYIPAERPVFGRESYSKLLPWQQHCEMMRAIVRAGLPVIVYGLIIGFPDDTDETLLRLEEAVVELHQQLRKINPALEFQVASYAISPIPGTPQGENIRKSGLLRFDDPSIIGGFWTPSCDTHHLSYEDISEWQFRLANIGKAESKLINYHGGLTKMAAVTKSGK